MNRNEASRAVGGFVDAIRKHLPGGSETTAHQVDSPVNPTAHPALKIGDRVVKMGRQADGQWKPATLIFQTREEQLTKPGESKH